jgi:hypothetical protein
MRRPMMRKLCATSIAPSARPGIQILYGLDAVHGRDGLRGAVGLPS